MCHPANLIGTTKCGLFYLLLFDARGGTRCCFLSPLLTPVVVHVVASCCLCAACDHLPVLCRPESLGTVAACMYLIAMFVFFSVRTSIRTARNNEGVLVCCCLPESILSYTDLLVVCPPLVLVALSSYVRVCMCTCSCLRVRIASVCHSSCCLRCDTDAWRCPLHLMCA